MHCRFSAYSFPFSAYSFPFSVYSLPKFIVYILPKISAGERPVAVRLLRSWVRIPPGHGYLSVVNVVCCQVEVSATS